MDPGLETLLDRLEDVTGESFGAETFGARFRTQKALYLLKIAGLPALESVSFDNYIRGPYSRTLARLYYGKQELSRYGPGDWEPSDEALGIVEEAFDEGEDFVEAVATIHMIREINPGQGSDEIVRFAERKKPELDADFSEALAFVERRDLIA